MVSLLGLSVAALPSAYRSLYPPIAPPRTLAGLTELLARVEPGLNVVPVTPNTPANGIWLCEQSLPWEQLEGLIRDPAYAHRWQGVVLCEIPPKHWLITEEEIESWGDHFMEIGRLRCFGDPALLQRVHKAILDHPEEK
jgi:hypothetical protein